MMYSHKFPDALENALERRVVVVGALLDHRDPERPLALPRVRIIDQRVSCGALADRGLVELLGAVGPVQPVGAAVGRQIDRDSAAHQQRALMRGLVVVAVDSTRSPSAIRLVKTILFEDEVPLRTK